MRSIYSLLLCLFVVAMSSSAAPSQTKEKIEPLPANSTLTQSRDWLMKAISKNSGYSTIADSVRIGNFKLDGCKVSYRIFQKYIDQKSPLGDKPALGVTGASTAADVTYEVYEDISFDLIDLDPSRVGLNQAPTPKNVQIVSLETKDKKDLINFDRKGSHKRFDSKGVRSLVAIPINDRAGEAVARAFMYTIQLCQLVK
jgi:hypothetical protein